VTAKTQITSALAQEYRENGVVILRNALSREWLNLVETGIKRNLKSPGPFAGTYYEGQPGAFFDDYCNYDSIVEYRMLVQHSPLADMMQALLETERLWLFYEQIFIKDGGGRRTPWHQDSPYFNAEGQQFCSAWISVDPAAGEDAFEIVAGSHRGPLYSGAVWETDNGAAVWHGETATERLPEIPKVDEERDKWNIISCDVEPGDIVVFHPSVLHGGGGVRKGGRRRTLAIRFFGDDVRYVKRPGQVLPPFYGLAEALKPGDPLRHPYFPQLKGPA